MNYYEMIDKVSKERNVKKRELVVLINMLPFEYDDEEEILATLQKLVDENKDFSIDIITKKEYNEIKESVYDRTRSY